MLQSEFTDKAIKDIRILLFFAVLILLLLLITYACNAVSGFTIITYLGVSFVVLASYAPYCANSALQECTAIINDSTPVEIQGRNEYKGTFEDARRASGDKNVLSRTVKGEPFYVFDVKQGEQEWNEIRQVHTDSLELTVFIRHESVDKRLPSAQKAETE